MSVIYLILIIIQLIICVESKVCSSLDVRNDPEYISQFRDCRIVQGNLKLLLMEGFDDSDYFNKSFSELYEITDYLIVFKVMGLSSLKTIFPKLASIKGENLFREYALVLYELDDLEDIGISSLRTIGRGGLKINSCPKLCYVDTVNWSSIGISTITHDDRATNCSQEWCPLHCGGNCWSTFECQTFRKNQCDQSCIGCAKADSSKDCSLCKYFNDTGTCVQTCPKSKLIDNYSSKCIQSEDCVSKSGNWSIFKNNCVHNCPLWHDRNSAGHCTPATQHTCPGTKISSPYELVQLLGCTHIIGSLEIALADYVDTEELEKILGSVVSISGILKVFRSSGIVTLEFFKSLSTIKGEKLYGTYYSLFVAENPNLQKLFHKNTSLTLEKGEAFFQNNPYLCPSEYRKLKAKVTAYSNSEEAVCNFRNMNVTILANNPTNVTITWPKFESETFLGYTVYYVKNFSLVQVKDGFVDNDGEPSGEGWSSVFVRNNTVLLKKLTPYTNYSYYIKTNGISEADSVQTPIYCFNTAAGDPSEPVDLQLESQTDTTITVKWHSSRFINGKLSHYKLAVYKLQDLIKERNYCTHPRKDCNCLEPVDIQLFHNEAICIGKGDNYCNSQTRYDTEVPKMESKQKLAIQKRSLNYSESLQEYILNVSNLTRISDQKYEYEYVVSSLQHFTLYVLFMQACNDKEDSEDYHCGGSVMASQRTLKRKGADVVTDMNITVVNTSVIVNWTKPKEPNSILLSYKIEYKKRDSKSLLRQICLTSDQFDSRRSEIKINDLEQGRYKLRVKVVSLAEPGELPQWYFFRVGTASKKGASGLSWLYSFLIVLGSVAVAFLGFVIWRRYREARNADGHTLLYRMRSERDFEEDEWKLDEETVEIIKELGQNSLAILYRKPQTDS